MTPPENRLPTEGREALDHLYENAGMMTNGHTITYRGYTLEKVDWPHPEHDEYAVINEEGTQVESYTIHAFDSVDALQDSLDDIVAYDPNSTRDWLNRGSEA